MKNHEYGFKPGLSHSLLGIALLGLVGCGGSGGGNSNNSSVPASSSLASSAAVSSSSAASSAAPTWELVWSDEFNGTTIDMGKWGFEKNCWGGGNNEQQCYTDRPANSFVADGVLNIVAQREDFTGSDSPEGESPTTKTLPYTSARLRTKNIKEWTFGRFEIRAKLPAGQGTWPAIWMLPTNSPYGSWASSGEIDIMEAVNLKVVTNGSAPEAHVHGTLHFGRNWPGNVNSGADYLLPNNANPADDFHTYAVEWEEGEIRWYVDDVHFATQRETGWYGQYMQDGVLKDAPVGAPFDRFSKFHLLLNLAVGGNWAGNVNNKGVDESVFPQKMLVDFVRVYQCSANPSTGKGCATIGANAELVAGHQRPVIGAVKLPGPPLFTMFDNDLAGGLSFDSYNPDGVISHSEIAESGRGDVWNIVKSGANGNAYFKVAGDPTDMRGWSGDSELIFDYKVNSKADGAKLLVKLDSGWPAVSDVSVPVTDLGVWKEYRITLDDLLDNGNSLAAGKATLASIVNTFVVDPSAAMNVSFDNVRIEGKASSGVDEFAKLPLFTLYDTSIASGLQVQSYNPSGQISSSEVDDGAHGKVFKVVKTGPDGNVFFNVISGPANLNHWSAKGELVFDFKVNSKAADTKLLIKMDSGWPNVSDVTVPLPADGVWTEYRIGVADLIDNGNSVSCCPGIAKLNSITNLFVMEPSGAIDVVFDNVRLVEKQ
ncbi:glycoside hydrolase family 16 protein [Cellvibrio sp. KY-GH-1]|uniref:glycoside hydrolase family 16 protein n=1 Tax=Cellvibrio sp. KY-GH-1 TaxID=2303332 RepID=UPI001244A6D1|nr:glycoside hydrolase family 16 protein [Cellvibrio sp. KY-GH-1]QEY17206.1 glycoside hydrolase family 16 protein [Cellvibrio sp. KY-GH-1]